MKIFYSIIKKIMIGLAGILLVLIISIVLFMNFAPQFGSKPSEARLAQIRLSSNYENEHFKNQVVTEMNIPAGKFPGLLYDFLFVKNKKEPSKPLPVRFEENGVILEDSLMYVTWYGHSAILLEMEGKRILIDPMLGPASSPVSFLTKRFEYENPIDIDKLDNIDAVILSHDHYDHLDHHTISKIKDKVGHFYTALAVGEHLKHWGVPADKITELDWWQTSNIGHIEIVATPARHFSGRGIRDRNKTQWASWVILGSHNRVYFSGDSGYAPHFREIGEKFGPFDFTMVECGQYNEMWEAIHLMPEQSVQAHIDLKGKVMMPIHWGAFNLALHDWTDPIERVKTEADRKGVNLISPYIGDRFVVGKEELKDNWWTFQD